MSPYELEEYIRNKSMIALIVGLLIGGLLVLALTPLPPQDVIIEDDQTDSGIIQQKFNECVVAGGEFSLHQGYCASGDCYKVRCEIPEKELFNESIDVEAIVK